MVGVATRGTFRIWRDVVFALLIRHVSSKFNDKFGMAWAIIDPLIFILMLSFIRSLFSGGETHGMPVFVFMMYGMLLLRAFTDTIQDVSICMRRDKALYAFRQVQPISSVLAALIFNIIVDVFVFILILLFMVFVRIEIRIDDLLTILMLYALVVLLGSSVGLLFGIAAAYVQEIHKIRSLLTRPLMFISCVFFSLQDIPKEFWPYLTWNPLLHAIELSRQSAYTVYSATGVTIEYLAVCAVTFIFLALSSYRLTWKSMLSS